MKKSVIAWAAALALAFSLAGCGSSAGMNGSAVNSDDPARGSAGIENGDSRESARPTPDVNDAEDGGGAGGTNDVDNDGMPETRAQSDAYDRAHGGIDDEGRIVDNGGDSVMDDIGNAAGDVARGAGDAVGDAARGIGDAARDAGNAIGNAANSAANNTAGNGGIGTNAGNAGNGMTGR